MGEQSAAAAIAEHQMNVRCLQEDALESLYMATVAAGFALIVVALAHMHIAAAGLLGIILMLVPLPIHHLLSRRYLADAWALVALWLLTALAIAYCLPDLPGACLLALPVALAGLYIGALAGLVAAAGAHALLVAAGQAGAIAMPPESLAIVTMVIWSVFALAWLSYRPMWAAIRWSWESYERGRQQLELARDVQAELKQAVKDLASASAQAERLNQLLGAARRAAEEAERTKAEFVANVSHELRTPLNMVIGFAEVMLQAPRSYGPISPALRADLDVILRNSRHLSELIDDVLDLSQIEAGQMALMRERVVLREVVDAAGEAIRPLFESKNLRLVTEVPAELAVYADRTRLREVLLNLLSNAGRFTEQGGVRVQARVMGQEVEVSVADTGPGIAPEDQGKLFQPFQQIDGSIRRRYGGSGLGLSISQHFVELHGGTMWLESAVGRGTTILFRLPLEPPAAARADYLRWINPEWEYRQRTRRSTVPAPVVRPRLVVLESGHLLQRLLKRYVVNAEVAAVRSLEEAAAELVRTPAQALLVNDLAVGAALERLRQPAILPHGTPAIVCALPGEEEAAEELGVDGYLVKPVSQAALEGALSRLHLDTGTILIVDDEPDVIRLLWRMLASGGRRYRVLTAENGRQALGILRQERPDLVLMDLVMPEMDGFALLAQRSEEPAWRDVPVIVMSARDPAGHPVVTGAIGITRGGGFSVAQLLAQVEMLSGPLAEDGPPARPAPPEAPPD